MAQPQYVKIGITFKEPMAALIEAINIKRKTVFEHENAPYVCLDSDISTPTARGGQTLVRLKMRNLLNSAVFEKTFKANDKFTEPDLQLVPASYLYSDADGSHFLDQDSFETLTLDEGMMGIGLQLPIFVELNVTYAEPGAKSDSSSGGGTKMARLETGLEIRVPPFIKEGEKVKVATETREFAGRA
jgi:elongation factor P